jgi:osmotically inducible protein OsmC
MAIRSAKASWKGGLKDGTGQFQATSGELSGTVSFSTRFEDAGGTNPEELLAAAHAQCYSMNLAATLEKAGHKPTHVQTTAEVHLEQQGEGFAITRSDLQTEAEVPDLDDQAFQDLAEKAKACPVSNALDLEIQLTAKLVQ